MPSKFSRNLLYIVLINFIVATEHKIYLATVYGK